MRMPPQVQAARSWAEDTVAWSVWDRMLEVEFIDRSIALAGKAFVSFFPLVIVVAAFVPPSLRSSILNTLVHRLGIAGGAKAEMAAAFAKPDEIRKATSIFGLILTFFFANSFTTALQRLYQRVWRRPKGTGLLSYARGFAWLLGYLAYMALLGALRAVMHGGGLEIVAFSLVALCVTIAFWTITAWVMLMTEVHIKALLVTGVATSVFIVVYTFAAPYWMPGQIISDQRQFGFFGVALALIAWLSGAAICILLGATVGGVLVEGDSARATFLRFGAPSLLVAGAPPSGGAPIRVRRLKDAFTQVAGDEL